MPLAYARPVAMITTRDRKISEPFYGETLGLKPIPSDGFAALFEIEGGKLRLTEVPDFEASPYPVLGFEVDDIKEAVDTLVGKGVTMNLYEGLGQDPDGIWTAPNSSCKVVFFNDPDGNGLSLTQVL